RVPRAETYEVVCTLFDRTGSLVALSTEAKKFSGGHASLEMRREAANDVAALISLLPAERRVMLEIQCFYRKCSCRRGKGSTAIVSTRDLQPSRKPCREDEYTRRTDQYT